MARKPTAILVLGMHRSGTSAITRVLSLMGLDLPNQLMPPMAGNNETGFWESGEIAGIHDRLLAEIGSTWDDCLRIPESFFRSQAATRFAGEILDVLENDFSTAAGFVIKDPRICRFVPFWMEILQRFGARSHLVLIARHPQEVAASLEKRDHFAPGKSLHLWLRHLLDMERDSRGYGRSLITYADLLDDWRATIETIGADLGSPWPRKTAEAVPEIEKFLSSTLRHHHAEKTKLERQPKLYGWAADVYAAFLQGVAGGQVPEGTFDEVAAKLDAAEEVFSPAVAAIQTSLEESHGEVQRLRRDRGLLVDKRIGELIETHRRDKEIYEAEIAKLNKAHRRDKGIYEAEIAKLNKAHGRDKEIYEAEIAKLNKAHGRDKEIYEAEIAKLNKAHGRDKGIYEAEIADNRKKLQHFDSRTLEQRDSLERSEAERDRLLHTLAEAQSKYEAEITEIRSVLDDSVSKIHQQQEALENAHQQVDRLASERDEIEGLSDRLAWDLEQSRSTVAGLESLRQAAETKVARLGERSEELERDLQETHQDKDWLWERWHEAKEEIAAPKKSKVGRVIWWQWRSYLVGRHGLVRIRGKLTRAMAGTQPAPDTDSKSAASKIGTSIGRGFKASSRQLTNGMGWVYLLCNALWEQSRATARRVSSGSENKQSSAAPAPIKSRLPRVLLLSPYPIYPPHHGGGVRLYNLVQRLAEHCELHLLVFSSSGEDPEQREALSSWARSVHFHHWHPSLEPDWWHLRPPNAGLFSSDEAARQVAHLLATKQIDILQLEYTELGQYGLPRFANVKVVLTEHDLAFRQHRRRRKMGFHHRFPEGNAYGSTFGDWLRLFRYELAVCRRADQIHVMSEADGQVLTEYLADTWERIRVVPNAVDTAYYDPAGVAEARRDVLYVGNFQNLPNVDALEYLVVEIWPLVRSRHPHVVLTVVGSNPSERVTRYNGQDGIEVVGAVPDLRPYYHRHRLMVAPIRAGSGTRLKILEAFAAGLPVVSTTLGAEGIAAVSGEHLMLADDPQKLAAAMTDLLQDDVLFDHLSRNGLQLATESYNWQRSAEAILSGWNDLLIDSGTIEMDTEHPDPQTLQTDSDSSATRAMAQSHAVDISIIIPTRRGGEMLQRCLTAICGQTTGRTYEIVCVDSGSTESDLAIMRQHQARIVPIEPTEFDHGLTRDLGAANCHGEVLVFLNQDAIPSDPEWLSQLTEPLFHDDECSAVQGGIQETADPNSRFFWDSCGERFYFTRESDRWIERYFGIGFSTVNAAIRRRVWQEYPFGRAPIMEDKKWQKKAVDNGHVIQVEPQAAVTHTHNYELRSLWRRCLSEGFGWRLVGERYSLLDMVRDGLQFRVHRDLVQGLTQGKIRSSAELFFPWLRPLALYWGNHWSRGVKL